MRKKIIIILASVLIIAVGVVLVLHLTNNSSPSSEKASKMVEIMDATFKSADFTVGNNDTSTSKQSLSVDDSSLNNQTFSNANAFNAQGQSASAFGVQVAPFSLDLTSSLMLDLELLTSNFMGAHGGVPLTETNKKAIKGEAMTLGSPFAVMTKAFIQVYGDKVFKNNYESSKTIFHIEGEGDEYTINGVIKENGRMRSGVRMTFKKHDNDTYSYKFVEYSVYYDDTNSSPSSTLTIAMYMEGLGALRAELQANTSSIFDDYDTAYDSFKINKVTASYFAMDNYGAVEDIESTTYQRKLLLDFAKNTLEFDNQTYKNLCAINTTAQISEREMVELEGYAKSMVYATPYYYETNDTYVRDYYRVPSNVTVVKTGSIPATKTVYIHPQVTLIESRPFQQPQFLKEIVFDDLSGGQLKQIGSFDDRTGNPSFILSMTKVKNFSLPPSVKKLELGEYILNTNVEMLNLSTYEPEWLTDPSKITYNQTEWFSSGNKEIAYTTLKIGGLDEFTFKEARYINELYMPKFNMGISFNAPNHINITSEYGEEYYAEAHQELYDSLWAYLESTDGTREDWFENLGFVETLEVIDKLYVHKFNNIIPSNYFESSSDKENEKDKKDKDKDKNEGQSRKDFDVVIYYDPYQNSPEQKLETHRSINEILVYPTDYFAVASEEQYQYDRNNTYGTNLVRTTVTIRGADNLTFSGVSIDSVYAEDGALKAVADLSVQEKFYAPYVKSQDAIRYQGQTPTYFIGWSYLEDGEVSVYPYQLVMNNKQTLYPVYAEGSQDVQFIDNGNDTYSVKFIGTRDIDGALVIPSKYNGKAVTHVLKHDGASGLNADIVIFGCGIQFCDVNAVSADCMLIYPETIEQLTGYASINYINEENYIKLKNAIYYPAGTSMYGVLMEADSYINDSDDTVCIVPPETKVIAPAAFSLDIDTVSLSEGLIGIGINAFEYSPIRNIVLPSTVRHLGYQAFVACDRLVTAKLNEGLTEIPDYLFSGCTALESVIIPTTVTKFGTCPFDYCEQLGTVWENGRYLSDGTNPYAVLIGVAGDYSNELTIHEDTVAIAFALSYVSIDTLNIGSNLKVVGDCVLRSCDVHTINYNGTNKDWQQISFGIDNDLSNITVVCKD